MKKGFDFTGIAISARCHDGAGNYLMMRRGPGARDEHGRWDFVAGGLKFGETIMDAIHRELMEELNVVPRDIEFLNLQESFREIDGKHSHWLCIHHKARIDRDKVVIGEPDKCAEIGWFTMDNLPSPLHSIVPEGIASHIDKL